MLRSAHKKTKIAGAKVGRVLTRQGDMGRNRRAEARPTADLQIGVIIGNNR